jgi:hypothetical protein
MPLRDDPQHWRDRAAQMRALATQSSDTDAAAAILKLADEYDKLAPRREAGEEAAHTEGRASPTDQGGRLGS